MKNKIVETKLNGKKNGWLMELTKRGQSTTSYATAISPGGFKGYHLHKIRVANYVCLQGKVKVILYSWKNKWVRRVVILNKGDGLNIPINTPTGLRNIGKKEAIIINYPKPAYNPKVKEQIEYNQIELSENKRK